MEIIEGKYSGFCNGVSFTIEKAKELLLQHGNIYCLGEIVHNENIIKELEQMGMITINSLEEIPKNNKVIFRAHGEKKEIYEQAKNKNIEIFDLTCGKVRLVHKKIEKHNDSFVIIIGKHNHPEVIGHTGYCDNYLVIQNKDDLQDLKTKIDQSNKDKIYIVAQTTFNVLEFEELITLIKDIFKNKEIIIDNTICNATHDRASEVIELSKKVDKMIIVGGKNSSNTKELFELSKENCDTILIQEKEDLDDISFSKIGKVGLMGGASTPRSILDEIIKYLKKY